MLVCLCKFHKLTQQATVTSANLSCIVSIQPTNEAEMATRQIRARTGQLEDPLPEGKKLEEKEYAYMHTSDRSRSFFDAYMDTLSTHNNLNNILCARLLPHFRQSGDLMISSADFRRSRQFIEMEMIIPASCRRTILLLTKKSLSTCSKRMQSMEERLIAFPSMEET